jgi:hypothetical protein
MSELGAIWHWVVNNLDRCLALIAIVIAAVAMLDVRRLFNELEDRDRNTETRLRKELLTHFASAATFSFASQFIDFADGQPNREAAIAMLQTFHTQQLLSPGATKEQMAESRRNTRKKIGEEAAEWARIIVACGLGTMKDGWDVRPPGGNSRI